MTFFSPWQCQAARRALGLNAAALAQLANVAHGTVRRYENGEGRTFEPNIEAMRRALIEAGASFPAEDQICVRRRADDAG